jgi:Domain of unknown function (DUF4287)/Domain of unknown function (DUF5655)
MAETQLTERQAKWFASVKAGLERDTDKTLDEWAEIARTCPETKRRARLNWFKTHHGLLQKRASQVIAHAFGKSWDQPEALAATLWASSEQKALLEVIDSRAMALGGVIRTTRKGYSAWSRKVQFAALKPLKRGGVRLGLGVTPEQFSGLGAPRNESWSERLKACIDLPDPDAVSDEVSLWLHAAWTRAG